MAYRFARDDASEELAVRRIASEQIDRALRTIEAGGPDDAVYEIRKCCKKIRGLLRLVRPAFARYAEENAAFRDIGRVVSVLRDAAVLIDSFDAVISAHEHPMDRRAAGAIRRRLTRMREAQAAQHDVATLLAQCRHRLAKAQERIATWHLEGDGFIAIAGGLEQTYRRARKTMRKARENPTPERLHEWRKRCKYHWYHARLLRPIAPQRMKAHIACAHELGETLGKHHDLTVLLDTLATLASKSPKDPERIGAVVEMVRRRQDTLAANAFALGERLLAQKPRVLVSDWGAGYAAWRGRAQAAAATEPSGGT